MNNEKHFSQRPGFRKTKLDKTKVVLYYTYRNKNLMIIDGSSTEGQEGTSHLAHHNNPACRGSGDNTRQGVSFSGSSKI